MIKLSERKATVTCGENVVVTDTLIQTRISNLNSRDLFAGKSLRAHDLNRRPVSSLHAAFFSHVTFL